MDSSWLVFGPPGTGKTTYLKAQVERAISNFGADKVLVMSFTRAAAVEIGSRLVGLPKASIGTLHSICYRALDCPDLTEGHEQEFNDSFPDLRLTVKKKRSRTENAVDDENEGSSRIDEPFEEEQGTMGDKLRGQIDLLRARRIPKTQWYPWLHRFQEAYTDWKNQCGYVDFTDLLETCLIEMPEAPGCPGAIFFDEAQDASRLQTDLLESWGSCTRRLVLAGDDDQAIYFWAGADAKSFLNFPCHPDHRTYLRQSYRVPRRVHELSQRWIRRLAHREDKKYDPRDDEGFFRRCSASWRAPEEAISLADQFARDGKTVMIEAACSYMLDPAKAILRRRGLPFHNPWRVKRGDWNPLVHGSPSKTMPTDRLLALLRGDRRTWEDRAGMWTGNDLWAWGGPLEAEGLFVQGGKKALELLKKSGDTLSYSQFEDLFLPAALRELEGLLFSEHIECVRSIAWWLSKMREKERPKFEYPAKVFNAWGGQALRQTPNIILGTGHSLKGSEADVCILFPDLSSAGFKAWQLDPEDRQGIIRLFYVMMTRAREGIVLCNAASPMKVDLAA